MKFKKFITQIDLLEGKLPSWFEDSAEATNFMENIGSYIESKALKQWAIDTDKNFNTNTVNKLKVLNSAYNDFMDEMENAA